jgi:hypothetical protein
MSRTGKWLVAAVAVVCGTAGVAESRADTLVFNQGFETNTSGWLDSRDYAGFGSVERKATGSGGISSSSGSHHALVRESDSGPFTRFDGYRDAFGSGFKAQIDVYLDTNWALGAGFDYSVAANGSDGKHQRDFIFHVARDSSTGSLLVGGSNNTNFATREDLESTNHYVVTASGWYTLQHNFYDDGGVLAVDLNLLDKSGTVLFTETRSTVEDTIPDVVGGNRYGWFTHIGLGSDGQGGSLAVDNSQLYLTAPQAVPEPSSLAALAGMLGMGGLIAVRRRRRAG